MLLGRWYAHRRSRKGTPVLRLPAIASTVLVVLGLLTRPGGHAGARRRPRASPITWHRCSDPELDYLGLECGSLKVPLDHAQPDGPTITLALTRAAAHRRDVPAA